MLKSLYLFKKLTYSEGLTKDSEFKHLIFYLIFVYKYSKFLTRETFYFLISEHIDFVKFARNNGVHQSGCIDV